MKRFRIRNCCVIAFVAFGVANSVPAQAMQRYLHCEKSVYTTKQLYTSNVWRDDGADTDTDLDAATAFDNFVVSKYHVDDLGMKNATCQQDKSAGEANHEQDVSSKRWVGMGYTVVTTSWTYVK